MGKNVSHALKTPSGVVNSCSASHVAQKNIGTIPCKFVLLVLLVSSIATIPLNVFLWLPLVLEASCLTLRLLNASAQPILLTGVERNVFLALSQNTGKQPIKDV